MRTMLTLRAAAMLIGVGVGSAHAGNNDGQSAPPPFTSIQTQPQSTSVKAPRTFPLFTFGGVEVRVWAPVAPPYNSKADGDLAATDIWSAG
jgi:hypothetical protein